MPKTKSRDLRFYKKHEPEISEIVSDDALELYEQQVRLYTGLDTNPDKAIYGGIIALSPETKKGLQERLREILIRPPAPKIYPYSLCMHLEGLTYYELFKNTIEFIYLNSDLDPSEKESYKKGYEFLMEVVDSFSLPSAESAIEMTLKVYNRLTFLTRNLTMIYSFNAEKYKFLNDAEKDKFLHDGEKYKFLRKPASSYYAVKRFEAEVKTAIESVTNQAKQLLKEKDNNNETVEELAPYLKLN